MSFANFWKIHCNVRIKIGEATVEESSEKKLLGVILGKKLNFKSHVSSLCKRASQELRTHARVSTFMDTGKLRLPAFQ